MCSRKLEAGDLLHLPFYYPEWQVLILFAPEVQDELLCLPDV